VHNLEQVSSHVMSKVRHDVTNPKTVQRWLKFETKRRRQA
jgi:hypothetical protein